MKYIYTLLLAFTAMISASAADKTVELRAYKYMTRWGYSAGTNDWYCAVQDVDKKYVFYFDVCTEVLPGTYTLDDLDPTFSTCSRYIHGAEHFTYTSAQLTITQNEDGFYCLDALVTTTPVDVDSTPDETIHLVVAPGEEEVITVANARIEESKLFLEDNDWFVSLTDQKYRVVLDLINPDIPGVFAGTYTLEDCIQEQTYFLDKNLDDIHYFTDIRVETTGEDPAEPTSSINGVGRLDNGVRVLFSHGLLSGIDNVVVPTMRLEGKTFEQNRLIIHHQGKAYNAFGQQMK